MTNDVNHTSPLALVLIDVVNHFEFPDGKQLLRHAMPIVTPLAKLKQRARNAGIPVIYVNDNFAQWRSDPGKLVAYCLRTECDGRNFVRPLQPGEEDYCVLKPMHSAFYQTPLDVLLRHLGASSLVLAGLATNSCVLCTAHDAKMRDYDVTVVSDCCAARTVKEHNQALDHIREMADGRIVRSQSLRFDRSKLSRNGGSAQKKRQGDGR
ncbi:MAG: cysteine hydrolase [Bryobacterales bacterium]|nr:cysteine hydrolase [Bryobacterales bacterium]MBV9400379.1 cysteine hydrolase [Bryobacterales bacterium]